MHLPLPNEVHTEVGSFRPAIRGLISPIFWKQHYEHKDGGGSRHILRHCNKIVRNKTVFVNLFHSQPVSAALGGYSSAAESFVEIIIFAGNGSPTA